MDKIFNKYINKTLSRKANPDPDIAFITYTGLEEEQLVHIEELVRKRFCFKHIVIQKASAGITSNCGPGTFGVLFLEKGEKSYYLASLFESEEREDRAPTVKEETEEAKEEVAHQQDKQKVTEIKSLLTLLGQTENSREDTKIRIDAHRFGYTGVGYSEILSKNRVECEYADDRYVVLMASPFNRARDYKRLSRVIKKIKEEGRAPICINEPRLTHLPTAELSVREALFTPYETVDVKDAYGRICASPTVSCPPAIPVAVSGEIIDTETVKILCYYGIKKVNVVK